MALWLAERGVSVLHNVVTERGRRQEEDLFLLSRNYIRLPQALDVDKCEGEEKGRRMNLGKLLKCTDRHVVWGNGDFTSKFQGTPLFSTLSVDRFRVHPLRKRKLTMLKRSTRLRRVISSVPFLDDDFQLRCLQTALRSLPRRCLHLFEQYWPPMRRLVAVGLGHRNLLAGC